jgi:N-acetylmuramoyl-L-alanine amidase
MVVIGRRSRPGVRALALLAAISVALAAVAASAQAPSQRPDRASRTPAKAASAAVDTTRTRFIIGIERSVEFKVSALSKPSRVLIDLPSVKLELPNPPGNRPIGVVKSFQHGLTAPGRMRVVIDVTGPVVIERSALEKATDGKSMNLVLDIVSASETTAAARMRTAAQGLGAAGLQPPVPKPAVPRQKRAAASCKPVIVIDPGHGGDDSGARKWGTVEKNVVLSFSLKFREKLEASGRYRVLMTRDTDVFVPLDARRQFAERHRAALFIAIHADYARRASARGATIYSLRPHVADALRRSAGHESADKVLSPNEMAPLEKAKAVAPAEDGSVRTILADLAHRDIELTKARTGVLARSVIGFMGTTTNLMENPDRNAAFNVLKTAKVPAILLELGYLTNEEDAQQLNSDQWRDKVSSALVTAIEEYFRNEVALRVKADVGALEFAGAC